MKIRNGFISNSSSSNFIVGFPHKPQSIDDTFNMMFSGYDKNTSIGEYDTKMTAYEIATEVFNSLNSTHCYEENVGELNRFELVDLLSKEIDQDVRYSEFDNESDNLNKYPQIREIEKKLSEIKQKYDKKMYHYNKQITDKERLDLYRQQQEESETLEKQKEELILTEAQRQTDEFLKPETAHFIAGFHFSDSSQKGSVLEHSNIFRNLPINIRISNH